MITVIGFVLTSDRCSSLFTLRPTVIRTGLFHPLPWPEFFYTFFPSAASSATKSCPFSAPMINFDVESIGKYFGQLRSTRFALNSAHEKSGV